MKEFVTIKNFGPLKNIENLELKQFTFLIGESASGKSMLMKVVAMMRYLYKMANIRSFLRHSNISKSPFRLRFDKMLQRQDMKKMLNPETVIIYRVEFDAGNTFEVRVENGKMKVLPTISPNCLTFNKVSYVSENRNIIPTWNQKASRSSGATLGFYFHETINDFAGASDDDKEVPLDYVGMRLVITHPKGKPTRFQIIPTDGRHGAIELHEASSGIQTSVPVAVIVRAFSKDYSFKEAFKRSVFEYLYETENLKKFTANIEPGDMQRMVFLHVEEPELSLFPDAQCKLIDELIYAATHAIGDRTVNMMLATHSPYILNYLNIMLNQTEQGRARLTQESLAVYRIYEGEPQNLVAMDDNGHWIVDTYDLSEMMNAIYNEFVSLGV